MGMEAADIGLIAADDQVFPILPAACSDSGTQQNKFFQEINGIEAYDKHRKVQVSAKATRQISLAGRESGSALVFAEHSDRLLCDPTNSLRAYGVYQFKYVSTSSESETEVQELLDRLMRTAMDAYERSVEVFINLSDEAKTAMILRHVPTMVSQVVALPPLLSKLKTQIMPKKPNSTEKTSVYSTRRKSGTTFSNSSRPIFLLSVENSRKSISMSQQQQFSTKWGGRKLSFPHDARNLKVARNVNSSTKPIGDAQTLSLCSISHSDEATEYRKTQMCPSKPFEDDAIAVSAAATNSAQSLTTSEHPQPTGYIDAKGTSHTNPLEEVVQTLAQLWPHYSGDGQAKLTQPGPHQKQQPSPPQSALEYLRMDNNSVDQSDVQVEEEGSIESNFLSDVAMSPCPTIHVLIDIVASRKALGTNPSQSRPHQLAQLIYASLRRYSKVACLHACVGISDTSMKLVCRDVLFPLQISPAVLGSAASFRARNARALLWRSDSLNHLGVSNTVYSRRLVEPEKRARNLSNLNIHKSATTDLHGDISTSTFSSGLLPYTRLPPVGVELIDQGHLFICMPSNFL